MIMSGILVQLYVRYPMSLTDRSQIFNKWKIQADLQSISTFASTTKRKGISLSKSLNNNHEQRSQSFIKLSARAQNLNCIEKRQIKLIIKRKEQPQQSINHQLDKQNDPNSTNRQIVFSEKDCGFEQILKKNKRSSQMQQSKLSNINSLRAKPNTLSKRQSKMQRATNRVLNLRL